MALLWLRAEVKPFEKRTPLTPEHAQQLVFSGHQVVVECSNERIFPDTDYQAAGCKLTETGSWLQAPKHAFILGIKELPESSVPLSHTHIYFAHAYKGQQGAEALLKRFKLGQGKIYDLEFITDESNQRVAAFSVSSGIAGASIALLIWLQQQQQKCPPYHLPLFYPNKTKLRQALQSQFKAIGAKRPTALIIGAKGRCGRGVALMLSEFDIPITSWDKEETQAGGPFPEMLNFDLLFNCVYLTQAIPPFLTMDMLTDNKHLSLITDISCDPTSSTNPLPLYKEITTFKDPAQRIWQGENPIDLIAIDHLPSFLPLESSIDFSEQLFPYLQQLLAQNIEGTVWENSYRVFVEQTKAL